MSSSFPSAGSNTGVRACASRLQVSALHLRQVEIWSAQGYPVETCGLLLGRALDGETEVHAVRRARNTNVERARDRFDLDPVDQLACEDEARARGLEVVGVWHSHPDQPATPSQLDRANAWARWSYLIVAVDSHGAHGARSWRLAEDAFFEEALVISDDPARVRVS